MNTPKTDENLQPPLADTPGSAELRGEMLIIEYSVQHHSDEMMRLAASLDRLRQRIATISDRMKPNSSISPNSIG